jgi:hypothetical protein
MRFYQLDNDTKKYIKRLNYNGIKTPTDITSVDQFIRGLKDLGIYGNMIEAWFFRKNHNAGSGNIIYSFRDSFHNGTINNISTAVWDDRGLICTSNATNSLSNYINGNLRANILPTVSMFSVFMSTPAGMENFTSGYPYAFSLSTYTYPSSYTDGSSLSNTSIGSNGTSWGASFGNVNNTSNIQGNTLFKMLKGSLTPSTVLAESRNSSSILTSSSTSNTVGTLKYDRFLFCGRWNDYSYGPGSATLESVNGSYGVGFHGTQIFHCFFNIDVNFTSFESLFKNTIGKGIDLR